jgi:type IV secretory pathway VirB10-like protein
LFFFFSRSRTNDKNKQASHVSYDSHSADQSTENAPAQRAAAPPAPASRPAAPAPAARPPAPAAPAAEEEAWEEEGEEEEWGEEEGEEAAEEAEEEEWGEEEAEEASGGRQVTALYDYAGENEGDLVFSEGDVITILDDSDPDGWYQGELNGVTGYFPNNYIEE